jgi:hypothetical protein
MAPHLSATFCAGVCCRVTAKLVFLADLTVELRAWPQQTWTALGVSPKAALLAVVDRWRTGHLKGLELGGGQRGGGPRARPPADGLFA